MGEEKARAAERLRITTGSRDVDLVYERDDEDVGCPEPPAWKLVRVSLGRNKAGIWGRLNFPHDSCTVSAGKRR